MPAGIPASRPGIDRLRVGISLPLQRAALRDSVASRYIFEGPDESIHRTGQRKLNHSFSGTNFHSAPFNTSGALALREPARAGRERAVDPYRLNV